MACIDGDVSPNVKEHFAECARCASEVAKLAQTQARLVEKLYRVSCPSPEALGEYGLAIVSEPDRVAIARHVLDCPRCAEELQVLRDFLGHAKATPAGHSLRERAARIIATLVQPPLQPAGAFRGSGDSAGLAFQAGALAVQLSHIPAAPPPLATMMGLIWNDADSDADLTGAAHLLVADGVEARAEIDHLGNFCIESITAGVYQLELFVAGQVVVIEDLRFQT
jgi:anti-sigma factor RsiW